MNNDEKFYVEAGTGVGRHHHHRHPHNANDGFVRRLLILLIWALNVSFMN